MSYQLTVRENLGQLAEYKRVPQEVKLSIWKTYTDAEEWIKSKGSTNSVYKVYRIADNKLIATWVHNLKTQWHHTSYQQTVSNNQKVVNRLDKQWSLADNGGNPNKN